MHTNAHHTSQTSTENRHDEYITVVEQLQTENACFGLLGLISAMQLKGDNLSTRIPYALSFVCDKFVKGSDERTKQDIALMTGRIRKWKNQEWLNVRADGKRKKVKCTARQGADGA